MNWLHRLFQRHTEGDRDSRQQLPSSIAQASASLGNATLTMLDKIEEMLDKPLSADERQSAEQSLSNFESALSMGVVPADQTKDARERIGKLKQKLSQAKGASATHADEGSGLLPRCGGCGGDQSCALEVVTDKNNNRGYLCSSCKQEYASLFRPESTRRFWMCGACGFRILAGTKIDAEVDPHSKCPHCGADVNTSLVNLSNDRPVESGLFGEPVQ